MSNQPNIAHYFRATSTPNNNQSSSRQPGKKTKYSDASFNSSTDSTTKMPDTQINSELHALIIEVVKQTCGQITKDLSSMINEKLSTIEQKLASVCDHVQKLTEENQSLKLENTRLSREVRETSLWCNRIEQHSRKNHIRIFGLPALGDEDPKQTVHNLLTDKLKIQVDINSIDAAHRLGRSSPDNPAAMIVRFLRRQDREKVLSVRKVLKGCKTSIHEDMTQLNAKTLNRIKTHPKLEQSWFFNGKIKAKSKQGKIITLQPYDNVDDRLSHVDPANPSQTHQ
jgi:regulator of replication initiation timing